MAVCRRSSSWEDILDRACRVRCGQCRAIRIGGRIALGSPVSLGEDESRIAPRCTAVRRLAVNGDRVTLRHVIAGDEIRAVCVATVIRGVDVLYLRVPRDVEITVGSNDWPRALAVEDVAAD